jgi:hypothetical protein
MAAIIIYVLLLYFKIKTVGTNSNESGIVRIVSDADQVLFCILVILIYISVLNNQNTIRIIINQLTAFDIKYNFTFVRKIRKTFLRVETFAHLSLTFVNVSTMFFAIITGGRYFFLLVIYQITLHSIAFHFLVFLFANVEVRLDCLLKMTNERRNLQEIQILVDQIVKIYDFVRVKFSSLLTMMIGEFIMMRIDLKYKIKLQS